jgi:hypothetical protein
MLYVKFNYNGLELKGFVRKVTEASTPKKVQEFELIAHPDTPDNVSQLIYAAGRGDIAITGNGTITILNKNVNITKIGNETIISGYKH